MTLLSDNSFNSIYQYKRSAVTSQQEHTNQNIKRDVYNTSASSRQLGHRTSDSVDNMEAIPTSFIASTRPPSAFHQQSLHSRNSDFTQQSYSQGNDHDIWANHRDDDYSDNQYCSKSEQKKREEQSASFQISRSVTHAERNERKQRHYSAQMVNRSISPGQYFGARSLPLESMDELWQTTTAGKATRIAERSLCRAPSPSSYLVPREKSLTSSSGRSQPSLKGKKSRESLISDASELEPLWQNFKALPTSLYHRHQWNRWEIRQQQLSSGNENTAPLSRSSSLSQNSGTSDIHCLTGIVHSLRVHDGKSQEEDEDRTSLYSMHPRDHLTIKCECSSTSIHTHDGHVILTNHSFNDQPLRFSLFSANGNVTFDVQTGFVAPGCAKDIWIRPRKRILQQLIPVSDQSTPCPVFDENVALLVNQDLHQLKVHLDITTEDEDDDDDDDDGDDGDDDDDAEDEDEDFNVGEEKDEGQERQQSVEHQADTNGNLIFTVTDPRSQLGQQQQHKEQQSEGEVTPCPFCLLEKLYPGTVE